MTILCSGGKGEVTKDECLACARTGNAPCGYDYSIVNLILSDESDQARKSEIHVTDLTGCLRRAWYSKSVDQPEYLHLRLNRQIGKLFHATLENSDDIAQSELPIETLGITGRIDLLYSDGRLVDHKTTRWMYPDKLPYSSHALQVNIYAFLLKHQGHEVNRLQIQYIDMSGPTKCRKCRVPVVYDNGEYRCPECGQYFAGGHLGAMLVDIPIMDESEVMKVIEEKRETLDAALKMGFAPAAEPGYLCSYCAFADICQPE